MNNGVFRARQLPNCFKGQPNAANFLGTKGLLDGQLNIASFYRAETARDWQLQLTGEDVLKPTLIPSGELT